MNTYGATMFIQTEDTPNPETLKFLPGKDVLGAGVPAREFEKGADVSSAPLAEMLFMIPGVARVFFGADFVSVTKASEKDSCQAADISSCPIITKQNPIKLCFGVLTCTQSIGDCARGVPWAGFLVEPGGT